MVGFERCWYRIGWLHLILLPTSWLFRALAALRRRLYKSGILTSYKLPAPVVVIGNISVGGTGKTPLTLAIAQQLSDAGFHPIIVSRGFGGTLVQQPVTSSSTADQVGDEPLLMARRGICPVWVGRDRVATAKQALQACPQCDVVLCDDGLQHYRLQRDVEICVIDGVRRFGNGYLLPAGPLREPVSRLKTVDAVVVNGGNLRALSPNSPPYPQGASLPGTRCCAATTARQAGESDSVSLRDDLVNQYAMQLSGDIFYNLNNPEQTAAAQDLQGLRLHAVAGIGHPQRFFDHLKSLGLTVTPHAFADHHPYKTADLVFNECDALLLTEKDAVKCAAFADEKFWVLRVDALIDPALTAQLLRKIAIHGRKTA